MKRTLFIMFGVFALLTGCSEQSENVEWVYTTPQENWQSTKVSTNSQKDANAITIYPEREEQTIDGFGGCFNELGWEALALVDTKEQDAILASLFDPIDGCKFNNCRMPIGANDYAVDWYSHNETVDDFEMEHFSIKRDKERLVPYIKKAQSYYPELKVWASPWCPPSWMKTNNHYACKPDSVNDLPEEGRGIDAGDRANALPVESQFRMHEEYLSAYALYFSKFIQAYKNEGIDIYAVHVQNEPNSCQNFPSCIWVPKDLARFIGDYLGPRLAEDQPDVDLWLGTIERPQIERISEIVNYPNVKPFLTGVGFQWGGRGAIADVHKTYPEFKLMQTETECGDGSNDWAAAEHTFQLMKHYFNNGANAYLYWNMVLDETGKSQWGWKQNSMISINRDTKKVVYNPEFYLMKHFSAFIELGAHKVQSSDPNCLAFKNDNSLVVIYYNDGAEKEQTFAFGSSSIVVSLPEKSFNTFKIQL